MIKSYKINKGYNLILDGEPERIIDNIETDKIIIHPSSIKGIKTKLLVNEGDNVKIGTPLFFDKKNSDVMFVSSGSGKVSKITFGERRVVDSIEILLDGLNAHDRVYKSISMESLSKSGLLSFIRQRPFSKVVNPDKLPKSIFISAMPTAPYSIDYGFIYDLDREKKYNGFRVLDNFYTNLNKGINILKKITNCEINIISNESNKEILQLSNVNHINFNTLHPAGNVGIQIHKIDPIKNANDIVWYLSLQDLERIGSYFLKNRYPIYKYISIGGNHLENPRYVKTTIGTPINKLLENENLEENDRIISGDVLSGVTTDSSNGLFYFDDVLSIIRQHFNRDFLGWIGPGFGKFSLSGTFASSFIQFFKPSIDTKMNGSVRSIMPMGNWEKVLPLEIMPEFLIKNILCKDIDMMEKLGIYECDPEDFALCTLACQSKVEVSEIIKEGLDLMEEEG